MKWSDMARTPKTNNHLTVGEFLEYYPLRPTARSYGTLYTAIQLQNALRRSGLPYPTPLGGAVVEEIRNQAIRWSQGVVRRVVKTS